MPLRRLIGSATAVLAAIAGLPAGAAAAPGTERVSVSSAGRQGNAASGAIGLSRHGRLIAFQSDADNLVPADLGETTGIFIRDRTTGRTRREVDQAQGVYFDGRRLAFERFTDRLGLWLRDIRTGVETQLSLGAHDQPVGIWFGETPAFSRLARVVAFTSYDSGVVDGHPDGHVEVYVRDVRRGTTTIASVGTGGVAADGDSQEPAVSADGRFVAFTSNADNLVPGDTNGMSDVFVHDRRTGVTERVSVGPGGVEADRGTGRWAGLGSRLPALSSDGRLVAFSSAADNLVPGDTNSAEDVFLRDRRTGAVQRVSVTDAGTEAVGEDGSWGPRFLGADRLIQFESNAANLVPGDVDGRFDYFVRDLARGRTLAAAVGLGWNPETEWTTSLTLSADGRWVLFTSSTPGHVPHDTNNRADAFVYGPLASPWELPGGAP